MLAAPKARHIAFVCFWILATLPFETTIRGLAKLSLADEDYAHLIIVPMVAVAFILWERRVIFRDIQFCLWLALPLFLIGASLYFGTNGPMLSLSPQNRLSFAALALVVIWAASFICFYGTRAARAAQFSLLFLLLMVPIPAIVLEKMVRGLQHGSADVTQLLFRVAGVPVFRQNLVFSLPGVDIEVAEACSGIHSTLALLIVGLLAGHLCFESTWRKIFLAVVTVPISILKNALRIAVIATLGVYVDRGFLFGALHRHSGYPFAAVALCLLGPVFIALRKSEGICKKGRAD